jgi:hypothetical protein
MVPTQKSSDLFVCECCNYSSSRKSQYHRHLETDKHKILQNPIFEKFQPEKIYICDCGKKYKHSSTLYAHKKKCNIKIVTDSHTESVDKDKIILMLINQNAELRKEQTDIKELILEIVKNGTINNIHNNTTNNTNNTNTNSHNKAFNLNFFLNETCKNAMNITDFVDSIKLQLSDLMEIGEIGYVEGISKIIVKNLNNLDETIRPVHCTDKKRETMYIKDEGEWSKEDEKKTKLKKAVTKIADKNIKLLPQFREKYPEYKNSSSKTSDKYDKMVLEVMTCDDDKNEKIVKNISKVTIIKE